MESRSSRADDQPRVRGVSLTGRAVLMAAAALIAIAACDGGALEPPAYSETVSDLRGLRFIAWSTADKIENVMPGAHPEFNTTSLDGCPFISPDGKSFYMASNRDGGKGKLDIWVSTRKSVKDPWGEPVNVGAPVNTDADDFCPTIARDNRTLYFVSRKQVGVQGVDWCGAGDIYVARRRDGGGFSEPENLGCQVNSSADEFSPFPIEERGRGPVLYFSSMRPGLGAGGDVYVSKRHGGIYQSAELVPGVNTEFDDGQPNLRRDGLEMFFYSNRLDPDGQGGNDIYVARRESVHGPWLAPVNLGAEVNSAASETRPSLSWNGKELYFGSNRPESEAGSSDIYITTRERRVGKGF